VQDILNLWYNRIDGWGRGTSTSTEPSMFTTLFFILLLVYVFAGGEIGEALTYGCAWLALVFVGEMIMWMMMFGIFGMLFL